MPPANTPAPLSGYRRALRLFSRDVQLFLVSSALIGFCWKGIYAVLFNLYLLRLGYGPQFIGIANAVPTLTYGLACLPAGVLGGRWGVRRAMIVGVVIVAVGLALPPCAEWLPPSAQAPWLIVSYSVAWVGAALYIVNANPFLMAATGSGERDHAFSLQVALWPLAGFVGSLLGGVLPGFFAGTLGLAPESPDGYRYSLFVAAALYVPAIPVLLATRPARRMAPRKEPTADGPAPWALITFISVVVLLYTAGDGMVRAFFNVYLATELELATWAIGVISGIALLAATFAALAAPFAMARWGKQRSFIAAALGMAVSVVPLALVPHWAAATAGYVGITALALTARPIITVYQMELVSSRWRAAMSGAGTMGRALSWSATALVGGYLVTSLGFGGSFLTGAALTAAGASLFWVGGRLHEPSASPVPAESEQPL